MTTIYIDADACPVKDETYKVAARYKLKVVVVANQYMRVPLDPLIQMEVVSGSFDAADDWIVESATMEKRHRSQFLNKLDQIIQSLK